MASIPAPIAATSTSSTVLSPSFEQRYGYEDQRSASLITYSFHLPGIKERVMRVLLPTGRVTYPIVSKLAEKFDAKW
jgi:hypothetical protein